MKPKFLLAMFCVGLMLSSFCIELNKPKSKKKKNSIAGKGFFEGYFYLQRLYPGIQALDNLKYSSSTAKLKYFTLNEKYLYYSKNSNDKTNVRGGIKLKRILDKRNDVTKEGKCCNNIRYKDYSPKLAQSSQTVPLFTKTKISKKTKKLSFKKANYCLEMFAPFRARWRICGFRPIDVYRLQLKIVFSLIKTTVNLKKVKSPVVIEKFLTNSKLAPEPVPINWNWATQKKWTGYCPRNFMQSPIKIEESLVATGQVPEFKIKYNLLNTHVEVVRRYNEIVINFKNDPGLIMFEYTNKRILYQPKYISFRFPGEHNILGKRYSGDMQIHCEEVSTDKRKRTQGLVVTIPMDANSSYTNFKEFEKLSVDFWKYMVNKKGSYQPKDFLTKKKLVFQLKEVMKAVVSTKPLYYFYLGSEVVPPCDEYVYHLVVGKPIQIAMCQFKILRENSLASSEVRQIHSRLTQINNPDDYDDGTPDDSSLNDGSDGGSNSGRGGPGHRGRGNGGIMALHGIYLDTDLDKYIDDEEMRRRRKLKPLNGKGWSDDDDLDTNDPLNC